MLNLPWAKLRQAAVVWTLMSYSSLVATPRFLSEPYLILDAGKGKSFDAFSVTTNSLLLFLQFTSNPAHPPSKIKDMLVMRDPANSVAKSAYYFVLDDQNKLWRIGPKNVLQVTSTNITAMTIDDEENLFVADENGNILRLNDVTFQSKIVVPSQLLATTKGLLAGFAPNIIAIEKVSPSELVLVTDSGTLVFVNPFIPKIFNEFEVELPGEDIESFIADSKGAWITLIDSLPSPHADLVWVDFNWDVSTQSYQCRRSPKLQVPRALKMLDIDSDEHELQAISGPNLNTYGFATTRGGKALSLLDEDPSFLDPAHLNQLNPAFNAVRQHGRFVDVARHGFDWRGPQRHTKITATGVPPSGPAVASPPPLPPPPPWSEAGEFIANPVASGDFAKLLAFEWKKLHKRTAPNDKGMAKANDLVNLLNDDRCHWASFVNKHPDAFNRLVNQGLLSFQMGKLVVTKKSDENQKISIPEICRDMALAIENCAKRVVASYE